MTFSINASLSAITAFGKKMGVHAHNIANMNTEGFKRSRAVLVEGADQTVTVEIDRDDRVHRDDSPNYPVSKTGEDPNTDNESNNVDVATEIVGAMTSQNGYEANTKLIKTKDEMTGTLLDLLS